MEIAPFLHQRLAEIIASFSKYRLRGKLLDIGYGAGGLLSAAENAGWECWGTEIAPKALAYGHSRGWHIWEGDLLKLDLPEEIFDVVCMVEVLEHLEQPAIYLRKAWKALRPGGSLWLTTPNGASANSRMLRIDWSIYDAPDHLQLFTAPSLRRLLKHAGFTPQYVRTEGFNPVELRNRFFGRKDVRVDRVGTGIALNERISTRPVLRLAKSVANTVLNLTKLGDTLKALAEKPSTEDWTRKADQNFGKH